MNNIIKTFSMIVNKITMYKKLCKDYEKRYNKFVSLGGKMDKSSTDPGIYLTVSEVAKILNVSSATLRNWEKYGLFSAQRGENRYRYYKLSDIETLRKLKKYMIDDNGRARALRKIQSFNEDLGDPYWQELFDDATSKPKFISSYSGQKWKETRELRSLTLNEVSKATGISSSYLSKIENDKVFPSFETLNALAQYYGESLVYFVQRRSQDYSLVKKTDEMHLNMGYSGVHTYQLSFLRNSKMYPVLHCVEPHAHSGESHQHGGEEFVYILDGELTIQLNDNDVFVLHEGDSMSFKASIPHRYLNRTNTRNKVLWVHTP